MIVNKGDKMLENSKLVSVIVPVFNTQEYLPRCLTSICMQSYKNLEIIAIDDGSTDDCAKILDEYRCRDARIKVYHKPNGGLTSAVYFGVKQATGDYVAFVDSDDYVDEDFILNFYSNIGDADVLAMGLYYQIGDTAKEFKLLCDVTYSGEQIKELQNDFIYDHSFGMSQKIFVARWNKLYKIELVKKVIELYRELDLSDNEDSYFMFLIIHEAKRIKTLAKANGYHYFINPNSLTNKRKTFDGFLAYLNKIENASKMVSERMNVCCNIHRPLIVFHAWSHITNYVQSLPKEQAKREMKLVLKNDTYQSALKSFRYSRMDLRGKVKLFLFRNKMCGALYRLIKKKTRVNG